MLPTQVSWWTALWMALRANTVVASWPSTIGLMALVGRAMMSLPSAPLQFFKLIAENASDEHVHALLLVHQVGAAAATDLLQCCLIPRLMHACC